MKNAMSLQLKLSVLLACFCAGAGVHAAPPATAPAATAAAADEPVIPKSVFEMPFNESGAKECFHDPFFPKSQRYQRKVVEVKPTPGIPVEPAKPVDCYAGVVVRGISVSPTRRFATVNNQTFAPGDKWQIKTPTGNMILEVLEIKDRSVVVKAENCEQKELPLKF